MQPTLSIIVLPRKPQINYSRLTIAVYVLVGLGGAEGVALPVPDDGACWVSCSAGRTEVVGVEVIKFVGCTVGVDLGDGYGAIVNIVHPRRTSGSGFTDEITTQIIMIDGCALGDDLLGTLPLGVVDVGRLEHARFEYFIQSTRVVVLKGAVAVVLPAQSCPMQ